MLVGDKRGYVLIYLGGPEGYSLERTQRIPMWKDWQGGVNTAADLNGNGWLDLVVSSSGHYHRKPDTLTIFYGGPDGYGWHDAQDYKGGFSPGQMSVADLNNNGLLDLIVPAYSTDLTRVVPIQIFWNLGDRFDLEHPLELHADAGFEALPIDLNRNGWTDLFVACHRNDVGHVVDSQIFWNGPEGLSNDRTTPLPGMGPHRLNARLPGECLHARADRTLHLAAARGRGPATCPDPLGCGGARHHGAAVRDTVRGAGRGSGACAMDGPRWRGHAVRPAGCSDFRSVALDAFRAVPRDLHVALRLSFTTPARGPDRLQGLTEWHGVIRSVRCQSDVRRDRRRCI